jgi:TolB-like protein
MKVTEQTATTFSPEQISRQVNKILEDPHFRSSEILSNFLNFIVTETIKGDANRLKEYTIALSVLHKPKTFNPKENCIVRIHAVRLRKALQDYYNGPGAGDEIRISLPKGNYVPVFSENIDQLLNSVLGHGPTLSQVVEDHSLTTAVLPFQYHGKKEAVRSFTDGLGVHLSSALTKVKSLSLISYNISRRLPEKFSDIKEIGHLFHAQCLFAGDVQCQNNVVRVTVEMIRADTSEQLWSETFERTVTGSNSFTVQDEIISRVVKALCRQIKSMVSVNKPAKIMAVA